MSTVCPRHGFIIRRSVGAWSLCFYVWSTLNILSTPSVTLLLARGLLTHSHRRPRNDELWRDSGSLIPFKAQDSANLVKTQLKDLSLKLHTTIQLVFVSKKIGQDLYECETKPQVVNQQCVVYHFQCNLQVYVIQVAMLVIRLDILATKINHLPCAHNKIKPTQVQSLRTFSGALECWKNAKINMTASLMRCFTSNN